MAGGGGQEERQQIINSIDKANSPAQLNDLLDKYQHLFGGKLDSLMRQYTTSTFDKPEAFKKKLSPASLRALDLIENPTPNEQPATSQESAPNGVDPETWKYMTPEEKALWQK